MKKLKYCGFCGKKLIFKMLLDGSRERYCPGCDHVFFDSPSSVVLVAVTNGERMLFGRKAGGKHPYWSLISGYVKSGETAEKAAIREIHEETGLDIFNLEILGTYASAYGNLLIIGIRAETKGNSIRISQELEKAAWFSRYDPPPLRPNSVSSKIVKSILKSE